MIIGPSGYRLLLVDCLIIPNSNLMSFLINLPCFLLNFLRLNNQAIIIIWSFVYWRSKIWGWREEFKNMATGFIFPDLYGREQWIRNFEKIHWVIHEPIKMWNYFFHFELRIFLNEWLLLLVNIWYHIVWIRRSSLQWGLWDSWWQEFYCWIVNGFIMFIKLSLELTTVLLSY